MSGFLYTPVEVPGIQSSQRLRFYGRTSGGTSIGALLQAGFFYNEHLAVWQIQFPSTIQRFTVHPQTRSLQNLLAGPRIS